jgi:glycosyltransferase involved in cell wall biosynthesis
MKIDFLTSQPGAACSMFYGDAFKTLPGVSYYDRKVDDYDVILLMTYDHHWAKEIRQAAPNAKIGIIDPRNYNVVESTKYCDFLVVDSIEMEDYWRIAKKPIIRYAEYPKIQKLKKKHEDKEVIKVGYHGNLIHLQCMSESATPALTSLSKKYKIELVVMHGGVHPTQFEDWMPEGVKITHIPWSMENYLQLGLCDVGIVPNNILHNDKAKSENSLQKKFNYSIDDYSIRFKMPSNPGRFIVFGLLGIPVVADFFPSAIQHLDEYNTGFVACNPQGWEYCLDRLFSSSALRQRMGDNLQELVEKKFNFNHQNESLINFLRSL